MSRQALYWHNIISLRRASHYPYCFLQFFLRFYKTTLLANTVILQMTNKKSLHHKQERQTALHTQPDNPTWHIVVYQTNALKPIFNTTATRQLSRAVVAVGANYLHIYYKNKMNKLSLKQATVLLPVYPTSKNWTHSAIPSTHFSFPSHHFLLFSS